MSEYNKEDVLKIANALIDNSIIPMHGDFASYFFCNYCDAELKGYGAMNEQFKHETNCPCIIAKDLLNNVKRKAKPNKQTKYSNVVNYRFTV